MKPLFYKQLFNQDGRRIRAVFVQEVSNGTDSFRLWQTAGKQDIPYPRAENDKYLLYAEINGWLIPLRMTSFALTDRCGRKPAVKNLYGGEEERTQMLDALRKSEDHSGLAAAFKKETEEIERCGCDPACQADYIQKILQQHVSIYLKAKENGGESFPDLIGAAVMDDTAECLKLSAVYREKQQKEQQKRTAREQEEEKAYCEEQNRKAEEKIAEAVRIIRNGGSLRNETVEFYASRFDSKSYPIINYLMRLYQVNVPLRTQGWICSKLYSVFISDGKCENLQYIKSKKGKGSESFFQYMNELICRILSESQSADSSSE